MDRSDDSTSEGIAEQEGRGLESNALAGSRVQRIIIPGCAPKELILASLVPFQN